MRVIRAVFNKFRLGNLSGTKFKSVTCRNLCSLRPPHGELLVKGVSLEDYLKKIETRYVQLKQQPDSPEIRRLAELEPVVALLEKRKLIQENLRELQELLRDSDEEIRKLAAEDTKCSVEKVDELNRMLLEALYVSENQNSCDALLLEVNTGVGGQEAMLFARELFDMYINYANFKGWDVTLADYSPTDLGGIRRGSALIDGAAVYRHFRHEAGVHRVQRVPSTEKGGRVHTSTVSVLALPQATEIDIKIDPRDLKVETKRASGAGGQHVNTTDSAVRITHLPTNLSVDCQIDRSQIKNRQIALTKLRSMLYDRELGSQQAASQAVRKNQVRSNDRNEKIRTYNFGQDRITDHRLQGENLHNLPVFLQGGPELDSLIEKLDDNYRIELLLRNIDNTDF